MNKVMFGAGVCLVGPCLSYTYIDSKVNTEYKQLKHSDYYDSERLKNIEEWRERPSWVKAFTLP